MLAIAVFYLQLKQNNLKKGILHLFVNLIKCNYKHNLKLIKNIAQCVTLKSAWTTECKELKRKNLGLDF